MDAFGETQGVFFVAKDHTETPSANYDLDGAATGRGASYVSVTRGATADTDVYAVATAKWVNNSGGTYDIDFGPVSVYGGWFHCGDDLMFSADKDEPGYYEDCKFELEAGGKIIIADHGIFVNCEIVLNGSPSAPLFADTGHSWAELHGGSLTLASGSVAELFRQGTFEFYDFDFSSLNTSFAIADTIEPLHVTLVNCLMPESYDYDGFSINWSVHVIAIDTDDSSNVRGYREHHGSNTIISNTSVRIPEADGGGTHYGTDTSFKVDTDANPHWTTPFTPELTWTVKAFGDSHPTDKTLTLRATCATALDKNDVWISARTLNDDGSTQGTIITGRPDLMDLDADTAGALSTDSSGSEWVGGLTNDYLIEVSGVTVDRDCVIEVSVHVAKASLTALYLNSIVTAA
jgi:hypothetical protein